MITRRDRRNHPTARVVINRRTGEIVHSKSGSTLTTYISSRFANADEARQYYEQQGYTVAYANDRKVELLKRD